MTWEMVPLAAAASLDARVAQPQEFLASDVYVGLEHIGRRGQVDVSTRVADVDLKSPKNRFDSRHVLFGKLRPNLGKVARASREGVCSTDIYPLLPSEGVERGYLAHFLLTPRAIGYSSARTTGANLPRIAWSTLGQLRIPLPPLPEQRRIAAILDEADALRTTSPTRDRLLQELIDSRFEAALRSAVAGTTTIGELIEGSQYGTSAKAGAHGEFPILRMGNITADGRIDLTDMKFIDLGKGEYSKYLVRQGDVLFNRTNSADLVGKTAVYREPAPRAFAGYLVRLRPKSAELGEYVAGYLNSRHGKLTLRKMAKSIVGMANINAQEAKSIRLPVPTSELLSEVVQLRSDVDAQRQATMARARTFDALFASLQHRAFRGEL